MAMGKCRECGTEVSDQAKTCPKCGVDQPVKKKTSLFTWIIAIIFGLIVYGAFSTDSPSTPAASAPPPPPKYTEKEQAALSTKLEDMNWQKGGFENVMLLDATIKNVGTKAVKDIEITCTHFSNSGTQIDSNKRVLYEAIQPGKTFKMKKFNMGIIHSQANSSSCEVTDVVLL